ncbi:MAG: peptidylprolyl isomerase [Nanoarchaeota archaeon]|nr:peptidylprolyl isomerase [Nanoarchaeota archaeon]MBU1854246.1 peptidylprolyl isomerase [Nanoarchaeota archaeon]
MSVKKGDKVKVEYTGTFDDGTVFDSSEKHGKQLEFEVGASQVIKGFEEAVMGMEQDAEKDIKLEPKDAYGDPNPMLIKKIPRDRLPKDQEPKANMMLMIGTPDGKQLPAMITDVNEKEITVDLNHPLAGRNLNFKLKVVGIN